MSAGTNSSSILPFNPLKLCVIFLLPHRVKNIHDLSPFYSVQLSSVSKSCPTLCDRMDCSTPGSSAHHRLPEFAQIRVHRVRGCLTHLTLYHTLLLLPSVFPSIRVFVHTVSFKTTKSLYGLYFCSFRKDKTWLEKFIQGWSDHL